MKKKIIAVVIAVILMFSLVGGYALAASVFQTEMEDFEVAEPLDIQGSLTPVPSVGNIYYPGETLATGTFTVYNKASLAYAISPSLDFQVENRDGPWPWVQVITTVITKTGDRQTFEPWETITINPKKTLKLEVVIRTHENSWVGKVINPVFRLNRYKLEPIDQTAKG